MKTKHRPEKITLTFPIGKEAEMEALLKEVLHKRACMKKESDTTFVFYPTISEYFLLSVKLGVMSKKEMEK